LDGFFWVGKSCQPWVSAWFLIFLFLADRYTTLGMVS
jgi:hypothetical protein